MTPFRTIFVAGVFLLAPGCSKDDTPAPTPPAPSATPAAATPPAAEAPAAAAAAASPTEGDRRERGGEHGGDGGREHGGGDRHERPK